MLVIVMGNQRLHKGMLMDKKCAGLIGLIFGHRFQVAQDTNLLPPSTEALKVAQACSNAFGDIDIPTGGITTVRAIYCTRCGHVIPVEKHAKPS
jgi:hypothetical protein